MQTIHQYVISSRDLNVLSKWLLFPGLKVNLSILRGGMFWGGVGDKNGTVLFHILSYLKRVDLFRFHTPTPTPTLDYFAGQTSV